MYFKPGFFYYSVVGRKADGSVLTAGCSLEYETLWESKSDLEPKIEAFKQMLELQEIVVEGLTKLGYEFQNQLAPYRIKYALVLNDEIEIVEEVVEVMTPNPLQPFRQEEMSQYMVTENEAKRLWVISFVLDSPSK